MVNYKIIMHTFRIENTSKFASGNLYIIATPIGNMGDISQRALEALRNCSHVACEDSRVTGKLLQFYGINKPMLVCNDYTESSQVARVLELLQAGHVVALVSDAGTPLISDPGYVLVRAVRQANFKVTTIPGACSVITALTIAELPINRFMFIGFLHNKSSGRRQNLVEVADLNVTIVCFETARRLTASLQDIYETLGDRHICMARELTKTHEEVWNGTVLNLIEHCKSHKHLKGEIVLVIAGSGEQEASDEEIVAALRLALSRSSHADAVAEVATALRAPRRKVYRLALQLQQQPNM